MIKKGKRMNEENEQSEKSENMDNTPTFHSLPIYINSHKPCVNMWMEKMNKGLLTLSNLKEHWRVWVPNIYSPEANDDCLDWNFDEDTAKKMLFSTLEEFICNGEPQVVLKLLSELDNPPSVCGRVLKMGEPTYNCRECGVDSTCVLCLDCFKQSAHRNHKYKMGTSPGGGCCDCGDTEAWKKEPYCKIHLAGIQARESGARKLPQDVIDRAVFIFEAVLKYCYELLSMEHTPGLPSDLTLNDTDENPLGLLATADTYCTVLYNDEIHTFDQVISTLTRVIKCTQRDAIEFVTNIDREGRTVIKCSGFFHCSELKSEIERFMTRNNNRPLKVLVVHAHVIAHQIFAMKLLRWLQGFISLCEGFRILFSNIALNTKLPEITIVEGILMRDSQLWKSARTAWHKLFITGMLMEYESKKALAIVFTQRYGSVMKDFIRDDHDHSFSIVSFSVQLYTTPTLAHHLIAHHDVLFLLFNTFISESSRKCNTAGKLEFERNSPNIPFKRAHFILYDLRYLLSVKPDTWTDELRRGFLQGVNLLLTLLCSMQSMDAVVRQVGQHMEYEPEWESAFNLHIKLFPVVSLALEWCGSDKTVLIKAFRLVLKKLYEQPDNGRSQVRELADHSTSCIQYDVSSEPVSIHLPLSRFLAGLFLYLEQYDLHFQSPEFAIPTKPTPEQIIEPVLRAQAMISQVHAGMWRRNGYSLINQLYFYHNVKCRTEMLDRDIILLQAGAALIESNEFLILILNKFNLLNWADPEFEINTLRNPEEDSIRQTINLVEEFLGLLNTIIGERHVPGVGEVTEDDRLRKEIIQQLCIKPLSHSELNKTLPDDVHHETGMERVIDDVANFKKSMKLSGGKGLYKLKPHLYSEYNVFFYHYTKEELSKSEEEQRKRRKAAGELECCPPPRLPKLTESFSLVANLLKCDVMFHIMETVLSRALNLRARSYSEPQVHKILHLIGYALQEQESGNYAFLNFTSRATKWNILKYLEELSSSPRIDSHADLLTWVLGKYREVAGVSEKEPVATTSTQQTEEPEKNGKEWRTKMAAQKRAKIMAQMAAMQNHFLKKNAKLFEETTLEIDNSETKGSPMDLVECTQDAIVALGPNQTNRLCDKKTDTCILCQEDQTVTATGSGLQVMVLAAFVQQSTVLCQNRDNAVEPDPLYLSANLGASPHTRTCGHVMHALCWQKYFEIVFNKENRRPYRLRQPSSFDVDQLEYLCPLCECLSNTILPLMPALGHLQPSVQQPKLTFENWLNALKITLTCKGQKNSFVENVHDPTCRYCKVAMKQGSLAEASSSEGETFSCPVQKVIDQLGDDGVAFQSLYSKPGPSLSEHLMSMIHTFAEATYTKGLNVREDDKDPRVPLLAWKSTAYTIHAIECLLRETDKPLLGALSSRQRDSLEGLARISAVMGSTRTDFPTKSESSSNDMTIANHALAYLSILLDSTQDGVSIYDWDPFGLLVGLVNSLPSLFNTRINENPTILTGGIAELYALKLVFIALIVKILLTTKFEESEVMDVDGQLSDDDCKSILKMAENMQIMVGSQSAAELWRRVKNACLPFLRCCALYFHYVTDVPAFIELTCEGGDTYENICKYLGLPTTCDKLLDSDVVMQLAKVWSDRPDVQDERIKDVAVKEPLRINKLVDLPDDYSELINMVSLFACPNSDREDSRNPTMCLVCGAMLCSQSYCCQTELNKMMVGACSYHASKCGSGVSVFLRVRECEILYMRSPNRGYFACPPYVDEYGETDQGLRRGNPMRLCRDKYKQLNQLWLDHGLHEAIARAIESSSNLMSTQWHHL